MRHIYNALTVPQYRTQVRAMTVQPDPPRTRIDPSTISDSGRTCADISMTSNPAPTAMDSTQAAQGQARPADILATWGRGRIHDAMWACDGSSIIVADSLATSAYSPDLTQRRIVAVAANIDLVASTRSGLLILATERSLICQQPDALVTGAVAVELSRQPISIAISRHGELAAIDTGDSIALYQLPSGKQLAELAAYSAGGRESITFSNDGRLLAIVCDGIASIWDLETYAPRCWVGGADLPIRAVAFAPDGQSLLSAGGGTLCRWDAAGGGLIDIVASDLPELHLLASAANGALAAATHGKLYLWPAMHAGPLSLDAPQGTPLRLAFDPTGKTLLMASSAGLQLWRSADGQAGSSLLDRWEAISDVAFSPDSRQLATAAGVGRVWPIDPGQVEQIFPYARGGALSAAVAFDPTGQLLALGSVCELRVCRYGDGALAYTLAEGPAQSGGLSFSRDGSQLIVVTEHGVQIRRAADGELLALIDSNDADDVALAPDRSSLALVRGAEIAVWDLDRPHCRGRLRSAGRISGVALADNGRTLAISLDTEIQILHAETGGLIARLPGHTGGICLHPDGRILAAVSDQLITIYRLADGAILATASAHADTVTSLAFAPGQPYLASASRDGTVRLWRYRDE